MKFTKTAKRISAFVLGLLMVIMSLDLTAIRVHAEGEPGGNPTGTITFEVIGDNQGSAQYAFGNDNPSNGIISGETVSVSGNRVRFKPDEGSEFDPDSVKVFIDADETGVPVSSDPGGVYYYDFLTDGESHVYVIKYSYMASGQQGDPGNDPGNDPGDDPIASVDPESLGKLSFSYNEANGGTGSLTVLVKAQGEGNTEITAEDYDITNPAEDEIDLSTIDNASALVFQLTPGNNSQVDTVRGVKIHVFSENDDNQEVPLALTENEARYNLPENYTEYSYTLEYGFDSAGGFNPGNAEAGRLYFKSESHNGGTGTLEVKVKALEDSEEVQLGETHTYTNPSQNEYIELSDENIVALEFVLTPDEDCSVDVHRGVNLFVDGHPQELAEQNGVYRYEFNDENYANLRYELEYGFSGSQQGGGEGGNDTPGANRARINVYSNPDGELRDTIIPMVREDGMVWEDCFDENGDPILDEEGRPVQCVEWDYQDSWQYSWFSINLDEANEPRGNGRIADFFHDYQFNHVIADGDNSKEITYDVDEDGKVNLWVYMNWSWRPTEVINVNGVEYYMEGSEGANNNPDAPTFTNFDDPLQWLDACTFLYRNQSLRFELKDIPTEGHINDGVLDVDVIIDIRPIEEHECYVGNFGWTAEPDMSEDDSYIGNSHIELVSVEYPDASYYGDTNEDGLVNDDDIIVFTAEELNGECEKFKFEKNAKFVNFGAHEYETDEFGRINWENPVGNGYEKGEMLLPSGSKVTVKVIPYEGYQVRNFRANDGNFDADEDVVGQYTFIVGKGNFHLGAEVTEAVDEVVTDDADAVLGGSVSIDFSEEEKNNEEKFKFGTAKIEVEDVNINNESKEEFDRAIDYGGREKEEFSVNYFDISLYNSVKKGGKTLEDGTEDSWDNQIDCLDEEAEITLQLNENVSVAQVVHEEIDEDNNPHYVVLDAQVDPINNTVTFKTRSFSNFAIVTRTIENITNLQLDKTTATIYKSKETELPLNTEILHDENDDSIITGVSGWSTANVSYVECIFTPAGAHPNVVWTSSNENVVKVIPEGSGEGAYIWAVGNGTANVKATVTNIENNKKFEKTCSVTVKDGVVDVFEERYDEVEDPETHEMIGVTSLIVMNSFGNVTDAGEWIKSRWEFEENDFHEQHPEEEYFKSNYKIKLYADQTVAKAKIPSVQFGLDSNHIEFWLNQKKLTVQGDYNMGDPDDYGGFQGGMKIVDGTFVCNTLNVSGNTHMLYSEDMGLTTVNVTNLNLFTDSSLVVDKFTVSGRTVLYSGSHIGDNNDATFNTITLIEAENLEVDPQGNLCPSGMDIFRYCTDGEEAKLAINGIISGTDYTNLNIGIIYRKATEYTNYYGPWEDPSDGGNEQHEGIIARIDSVTKLYDTKQTSVSKCLYIMTPNESFSRYTAPYYDQGAVWAGAEVIILRIDGRDEAHFAVWKDAAATIAAINDPNADVELEVFEDIYVGNNFKTPKAAKSIRYRGYVEDPLNPQSEGRAAKIYYTGNINLTTDTIFDNLDFEMVVADKNDPRGYSERDPYTIMTLGINGKNLEICNRVTFNTAVNFSDSKKTGSLRIGWGSELYTAFSDIEKTFSGTDQKIYYSNDFIDDYHNYTAVISGSLTNLGAFYIEDEQRVLVTDYISAVGKDKAGNVTSYTFTAPNVNVVKLTARYGSQLIVRALEATKVVDEGNNFDEDDLAAMKSKSPEKIIGTAKLTASMANFYATLVLTDNIQFTDMFFLDRISWIQADRTYNITNITTYNWSNVLATMQNTTLKGDAYRTPYLNVSGKVDTFEYCIQVAVIDPETGEFAELYDYEKDIPDGKNTLLTTKNGTVAQFEPFHAPGANIDDLDEEEIGAWYARVNDEKLIGIDRSNDTDKYPVGDYDTDAGFWEIYAIDSSVVCTRPYEDPEDNRNKDFNLKSNIPAVSYLTTDDFYGANKKYILANARECQFSDNNLNGYFLKKNGSVINLYTGDKVEVALFAINDEDQSVTIYDMFAGFVPENGDENTFELIGYYPSWDEAVATINAGKEKRRYAFVLVHDIGGEGKKAPVALKFPTATKISELTVVSYPGNDEWSKIYYTNQISLTSDTVFGNVVLMPVKSVKKGTKITKNGVTNATQKDGYIGTSYPINADAYNLSIYESELGSVGGESLEDEFFDVQCALGKISGKKNLSIEISDCPSIQGITGFENVEIYRSINVDGVFTSNKNVYLYGDDDENGLGTVLQTNGDVNITGWLYYFGHKAELKALTPNVTIGNIDISNTADGNDAKLFYTRSPKQDPKVVKSNLKITGEVEASDNHLIIEEEERFGFAAPLDEATLNAQKITLADKNVIASIGKITTDKIIYQVVDSDGEVIGTAKLRSGEGLNNSELVKANGNLYYTEQKESYYKNESIVRLTKVQHSMDLYGITGDTTNEYFSPEFMSDYIDWNEAVKEINNLNDISADYNLLILSFDESNYLLNDTNKTDNNKYSAVTFPQTKKFRTLRVVDGKTYGFMGTISKIAFSGDIKAAGHITFQNVQFDHRLNASSEYSEKNGVRNYGSFKITVDKMDKNDPLSGALVMDFDSDVAPRVNSSVNAVANGTVSSISTGTFGMDKGIIDVVGTATLDNLVLYDISEFTASKAVKVSNEIYLDNGCEAVFNDSVSSKVLKLWGLEKVTCQKTATFNEVQVVDREEGSEIIFNGTTTVDKITTSRDDGEISKYARITTRVEKNKPLLTIKDTLEKTVFIDLINSDGEIYNNAEAYYDVPLVIAPKADADKVRAWCLKDKFVAGNDEVISYKNASNYIINTKIADMLIRVEKEVDDDKEIFNYAKTWNDAVNSINAANDKQGIYIIYFMEDGLWRTNSDVSQGDFKMDPDVDDVETLETVSPAALTFPKASAADTVTVTTDSYVEAGLIYSGNIAPATNVCFDGIILTTAKQVSEKNNANKVVKYFVPSGENTNINIAADKYVEVCDADSLNEEGYFAVNSVAGAKGTFRATDSWLVVKTTANVKNLQAMGSGITVLKSLSVAERSELTYSELYCYDALNMPKATLRLEESDLYYFKNSKINNIEFKDESGIFDEENGAKLDITNIQSVGSGELRLDYCFTKPTNSAPAATTLSINGDILNSYDSYITLTPRLYKDGEYTYLETNEFNEIFATENGVLNSGKYIYTNGGQKTEGYGWVNQKLADVKKADTSVLYGPDGSEGETYLFNQGLYYTQLPLDIEICGYTYTGEGWDYSGEATYYARFSDWSQATAQIERIASSKPNTPNSLIEVYLIDDIGEEDAPIAFNLPGKMAKLEIFGSGNNVYMTNSSLTFKADTLFDDMSVSYMKPYTYKEGNVSHTNYVSNLYDINGGQYSLVLAELDQENNLTRINNISAKNLEIIFGKLLVNGKVTIANELSLKDSLAVGGNVSAKEIYASNEYGIERDEETGKAYSLFVTGDLSATTLKVDNGDPFAISSKGGKVVINDIVGVNGDDRIDIEYRFTEPKSKTAGASKLEINGNITGATVNLCPKIKLFEVIEDERMVVWSNDAEYCGMDSAALELIFDINNHYNLNYVNASELQLHLLYDQKLATIPKASLANVEIDENTINKVKINKGLYITDKEPGYKVCGYNNRPQKTYETDFIDFEQAMEEIGRIGSNKYGEDNNYVELILKEDAGLFSVNGSKIESKPVKLNMPKNVIEFTLKSDSNVLDDNRRIFVNTATININSDTALQNVTLIKGVTNNKKKLFDPININGKYNLILDNVYTCIGVSENRGDFYSQFDNEEVYTKTTENDKHYTINSVSVRELLLAGDGNQYSYDCDENEDEQFQNSLVYFIPKITADSVHNNGGLYSSTSISAKHINTGSWTWLCCDGTFNTDSFYVENGEVILRNNSNVKVLQLEGGRTNGTSVILDGKGKAISLNVKEKLSADGGFIMAANSGNINLPDVYVKNPFELQIMENSNISIGGNIKWDAKYAGAGISDVPVFVKLLNADCSCKTATDNMTLLKAAKAESLNFEIAGEMLENAEEELQFGRTYKVGDMVLFGSNDGIIDLYEVPAFIFADAKGNMIDVNQDGYLDEKDYDCVDKREHIGSYKKFEDAVKRIDSIAGYKRDVDGKTTNVFSDYEIDFNGNHVGITGANDKMAALTLPGKAQNVTLKNGVLFFSGNVTLKSNVKLDNFYLSNCKAKYTWFDEEDMQYHDYFEPIDNTNYGIGNYTLTLSNQSNVTAQKINGNKSNVNSRVIIDSSDIYADLITVNTLILMSGSSDQNAMLHTENGFDVVNLYAIRNERESHGSGTAIEIGPKAKRSVSGCIEAEDGQWLEIKFDGYDELEYGTVLFDVSKPELINLDNVFATCSCIDWEDYLNIVSYNVCIRDKKVVSLLEDGRQIVNTAIQKLEINEGFVSAYDGIYLKNGVNYESLSHMFVEEDNESYGTLQEVILEYQQGDVYKRYSNLFVKDVWGDEEGEASYITINDRDNNGISAISFWDPIYSRSSEIVLIPLEFEGFTVPIWTDTKDNSKLKFIQGDEIKTIAGSIEGDNNGFYVQSWDNREIRGNDIRRLDEGWEYDIFWEEDIDGNPGTTRNDTEFGAEAEYTTRYFSYYAAPWRGVEHVQAASVNQGISCFDLSEFAEWNWKEGGYYAIEDTEGNLLAIVKFLN